MIKFSSIDNPKRFNIIKSSIEALEFAKHNDYKNALKIMSNNFSNNSDKEQIEKSILFLQKMIKNQGLFLMNL